MVTATPTLEQALEAMSRSEHDIVLAKPVRQAQLLTAIEEAMALRAKRLADGLD